MFTSYKRNMLLGLLIVITVTGCTSRDNLRISKDFQSKPCSIVIAQMSGVEKPSFYRQGSQGAIEFFITEAMTDSLQEAIFSVTADPIVDKSYYKKYGSHFDNGNNKVFYDNTKINKRHLKSVSNATEKHAPYDFSFLKEKHGTDYALLLNPHAFGVVRSYYGVIPLGSPKGYADISLYLVNLKDNTIEGEYRSVIEERVIGEWDTPPHYSSVTKATEDALTHALEDAYVYLLNL